MQTEQIKAFARTIAIAMPSADADFAIPVATLEELASAYEQIAKLTAVLTECQSYFENASDIVDGSYGEPAPNREMALLIEIDGILS
jgi:hypothetical protein